MQSLVNIFNCRVSVIKSYNSIMKAHADYHKTKITHAKAGQLRVSD